MSASVHSAFNVLIVDDEEELRELYGLILAQEFDINITEAGNGLEAVEQLEKNINFELVVSDFNMPKGNGEVVFKKAQELGVPFILVTSDKIEDHPIFIGKDLTTYIQKPFSETDLIGATKKLFEERRKYIAIPIASLLKIGQLSVPIYFQMPSKKMLKVFNAGDVFNQEAFDHWSGKNITTLLTMKDDFQLLVGDFKTQLLNEVFFKSVEGDTNGAIQVSSQVLEVLSSAAKLLGISNEVIELTTRNIQLVTQIVITQPNLHKILQSHDQKDPAGLYIRSHLTAVITNWSANELGLKTYPRSGELLSMASFFHDIGLDDETVRNENHFIEAIRIGSKMNRDQVERVKKHIDFAVTALSLYKGCPQEVMRMVQEHHELPDGTGFPKGLKADQLSELSSVFIVVHEFVEMFFDTRRKSDLKGSWREQQKTFNYPKFKTVYDLIAKQLNT